MDSLVLVFMILAGIFGIFGVVVVVHDIFKAKSIKQVVRVEQAPPAFEYVNNIPEVTDDKNFKVIIKNDKNEEVVFQKAKVETREEKFKKLPREFKQYYKEIINHVKQVENVKTIQNDKYEEYKLGTQRLIRLTIKRGIINCEFAMSNEDYAKYLDTKKLKVKQSATVLKVIDPKSCEAAKEGIDVSIKMIDEQKKFKKELAKQRRREQKAIEKALEGTRR